MATRCSRQAAIKTLQNLYFCALQQLFRRQMIQLVDQCRAERVGTMCIGSLGSEFGGDVEGEDASDGSGQHVSRGQRRRLGGGQASGSSKDGNAGAFEGGQ